MDNLDKYKDEITELKNSIYYHKLFQKKLNIAQARYFMECHVFSVWGFMSILKALQFSISKNTLPWLPTLNTRNGLTNFINEIVLSEESDCIDGIGYISHFEIYLEAMKEINADTTQIMQLIKNIEEKGFSDHFIKKLEILDEVKNFIRFDLNTAISGSLPRIIGSFTLGREKVIPNMFKHILSSIDNTNYTNKFITYLNRHIDIDGDRHGPLSTELLKKLCDSEHSLEIAYQSGIHSLSLRLKVWDKIYSESGIV
jgi:hypothetical protein